MSIISIVIPVYNEVEGIARTLEEVLRVRETFPKEVPGVVEAEVVVVDDGSRDGTAEIVRKYPGVRLVRHERNCGYGAALKTGFAESRGDLLAFLDADMTYPPAFLPVLCRELLQRDADVILGSRMLGSASAMPKVRRLGNRGFAVLLSLLTGCRITDTASGMRVFKKDALGKLYPLPDGLEFTPAMSTRALHEGMKIFEVPMPYLERVGRSKLRVVGDGLRFLRSIWSIAKLYNPLRFYGAAGLGMLAVAGLLSLRVIAHYALHREVPDIFIYRLFTIQVLLVVGINAVTFGAFANYVLSILYQRPLNGERFPGRLLSPYVLKRFGPLGLLLMVSAVILNGRALYEYVTTLHIHVHWVYTLTGAVLFLTGAQLLLCSLLLDILSVLSRGKPPALR